MKSGKIFKKGPLISEVEVAPGHYRRRYKKVLDLEAMKGASKKQAPKVKSTPEDSSEKKAPAKRKYTKKKKVEDKE